MDHEHWLNREVGIASVMGRRGVRLHSPAKACVREVRSAIIVNSIMDILRTIALSPGEQSLESIVVTRSIKTVCLYFSSELCIPSINFTRILRKLYYSSWSISNDIVFISCGDDSDRFTSYSSGMPWKYVPFEYMDLREDLIKLYNVTGTPTLVVIDAITGEVINAQGKDELLNDENALNYPWHVTSVSKTLFDSSLIDSFGSIFTKKDFIGKFTALYFSANWCPPCKRFTPILNEFYSLHSMEKNFEVVFVSKDKTEAEFQRYLEGMHWPAIAFSDSNARSFLFETLGITGIPALVVFDDKFELITKQAVRFLTIDPTGVDFPYVCKDVDELDMISGQCLSDGPVLITFKNVSVLYNNVFPIPVRTITKESDIGSSVKKLIGVDTTDDVLYIIDIPSNNYAVGDSDQTFEGLSNFITGFLDGAISKLPFS